MTPEQRGRITEIIVAELKALTAAALAAGVDPANVNTALDRRRRAIESAR